ncbi:hypothetical protein [Brachyspira alvinipulli]|uniref:hypothetical protein n=1 Tax=Brachyspira alvinipulli TaxID=84379 RepID=UPI00048083B3|nr:hypothetical protein [Brachyspira alvinipulli]
MDKKEILKNIEEDMLIIIEVQKNSSDDLFLKGFLIDNLYDIADNENAFYKEELNEHVKYCNSCNYYYFTIIDNDDVDRIKGDVVRLPNDYMTAVHLFKLL